MNDQPNNNNQPEPQRSPLESPSNFPPSQPDWQQRPADPTPQMSLPPVQPDFPDPNKVKPKRRKGLIVAIILAVVVVFGAGAAAAYKFWYQNPNKVVADGVMNAMRAKTASYKITANVSGETKGTLSISGNMTRNTGDADVKVSVEISGKSYSFEGGGIFDDKGDLYLKVKNLDALIKDIRDSMDPKMQAAVDRFITKVNDQWIKVSADTLKNVSEEVAKKQTCLRDVSKKVQDDNTLTNELAEVYKKYPFVTIKEELGSKDGSLGYALGYDKDKSKEYAKAVKDTKLYKMAHECDDSIELEPEAQDEQTENMDGIKTEIWVSRWAHEITKLEVNSDGSKSKTKTAFTFEPVFNQPVTITTPEKSKSLDDLRKDFEDLQTEIQQQQMTATETSLFS